MIVAALLAGVLALPPALSAQEPTEDTSTFEDLAACAQRAGVLHVQLLLDESGSLETTDANALRVEAAETALRQLARISRNAIDVEVQLSGFSTHHIAHGDWSTVSKQGLPGLVAEVERFAERTDGIDTDIAHALDGAHAAFTNHPGRGGSDPCRLLVLFTDGDYDIEPRETGAQQERYGRTKDYAPDLVLDSDGNAARAVEKGRTAVCDDGGIADQLRDSGVVTAVVALDDAISGPDQRFLRSVTGDGDCGSANGGSFGAYFSAADPSALIEAFDVIVGTTAGGDRADVNNPFTPCSGNARPSCTVEFSVDHTVADMHLLLHLDRPGVVARIIAPDGSSATVGGDGVRDQRIADVPLRLARLSDLDLTVDGSFPRRSETWIGDWRIVFVARDGAADAAPRAQLLLFGALAPRSLGDTQVHRDEPLDVVAGVTGLPDGEMDPTDLDTRMSAVIDDPVSGRSTPVELTGPEADGSYRGSWQPPDDIEAAQVELVLELASRTPSGVALQPRSVTVPVTVLPPVEYPRVATTRLRLSSLRDGAPATGTLTIEGAERNDGCVWVAGMRDAQLPRLATGLAATYDPSATDESSCLSVPAGSRRDVTVNLDADEITTGRGHATLDVVLQSNDEEAGAALTQSVPASFEMVDVVNEARREAIFWGLLIPGLLLPFVVLWLLNWRTARFEPTTSLRRARIPVRVRPDSTTLRVADGEPLRLHHADFAQSSDAPTSTRSMAVDEVALRARTPWWPLRRPYGTVAHPDRPVTGADGTVAESGRPAAMVPFALARTWWFVLTDIEPASSVLADDDIFSAHVNADEQDTEPDEPAVVGDLIVFLSDDRIVSAQAPDVEDDIGRVLPTLALEIAQWELQRRAAVHADRNDGDTGEGGPDDSSPDPHPGGWPAANHDDEPFDFLAPPGASQGPHP